MSDNQRRITDFTENPNKLFGDVQDYLGEFAGRVRNTLEDDLGLNLDWWSKSPFEADLGADDEVWVYQYVQSYTDANITGKYDFEGGQGALKKGSPSPEVQFKTGIYMVGEPTDDLKRQFRTVENPRLVTLFNTDVYSGYMTGFDFSERGTYKQVEQVSAREVENKGYGLGVPWFEVEAYDEDGSLEGYADGYFNPFEREVTERTVDTGRDPPQREVWTFGARHDPEGKNRYRIAPESNTPARERAKNARGKTAVINGFPVGSVLKGGRIQLKVEYDSPNLASNYSRKQIIEQSGTPYQALSEGANLYKVRETDDQLVFSTTKPDDWTEYDPESVSPDAVGVERSVERITNIFADEDTPTQFTVETDQNEGRLLGLYDPIVVRDIERGTELV